MAKIAVLITDDFEDPEYSQPAAEFGAAGHELAHLGLKLGTKVTGKRGKDSVVIDKNVGEAVVDDYDALFIPGGFSPDKLRAHKEPVDFARGFFNSGKPVFAICHGPQLLITAEVLKGRKLTGWKSLAVDIRNAGAEYIDKEVVVDGNLVTSRQPSDIPAFSKACLAVLSRISHSTHEEPAFAKSRF